jgi:hypothetical protein
MSHMDPLNPCAPFRLPLLHTLVEERAGERRLRSRFAFMERGTHFRSSVRMHPLWRNIRLAAGRGKFILGS